MASAGMNDEPGMMSLLSLTMAAAAAEPVPIPPAKAPADTQHPKPRRISSTGQRTRRLSDARDAASRPTVAHSPASALSALSLSTSPPPLSLHSAGSSLQEGAPMPVLAAPVPSGSGGKAGKKRGTIFTCESCSKVYRHPSCLIKHRWEHTPQWREASKFVLSKHQQVQLLEAAAILSHISPTATGTSLPEDRSLWPSFLSGGLTPAPAATNANPVSSSVPARAGSAGPRLHDFALPAKNAGTQIRPGVVGVPTAPVAVPYRGWSSTSYSSSDVRSSSGSESHAGSVDGEFGEEVDFRMRWTVKEEDEDEEVYERVGPEMLRKDEDEWAGMDMDMD